MAGFDDLRSAYPHLGVAVYAYGPGEPVTLEIITPDGQIHSRTAPSLTDVLADLFPELAKPIEPAPPEEVSAFG